MKHFKLYESWLEDLQRTPTDDNSKSADIHDGGVPLSSPGQLKMSKTDIDYLKELDKEYDSIQREQQVSDMRHPTNWEEEDKKFWKELDKGNIYQPVWTHQKPIYKEKHNLISRAKNLKKKFEEFNQCFLSQYYIEYLAWKITYMESMYLDRDSEEYVKKMNSIYPLPTVGLYETALKLVQENPFEKKDKGNQPYNAKVMKDKLEKVLVDRDMTEWKVDIVDNIAPRMSIGNELE